MSRKTTHIIVALSTAFVLLIQNSVYAQQKKIQGTEKIVPKVEYYKNGRISVKGQTKDYKELTERNDTISSSSNIGIWQYWHENGQLKYEDEFSESNGIFTLIHKNTWLPDGTQIMKDGNGYWYKTKTIGLFQDSLVNEVHNGKPNGSFRKFRKKK